jgi:DNA-binding response OmpR family regulator
MTQHRHILVVEGDPALAEAVGVILEEDGYRVTQALNLKQARAALASPERPDLLFVDLRTDGLRLLAHLRADPALSILPLVCTSTESFPEVPPEARAFLRKPFTLDQLRASVKAHCMK